MSEWAEAMKAAAKQLEDIAFDIPPPNQWTPRLVGLAQTMKAFRPSPPERTDT
jgi:hypothetical protein